MADFIKDETNTKLMQPKVAQSMPMKAKKASSTAHTSVSVSTGAPINAVILDEDGMSPYNKAGCNDDESAE